MKPTHLLIAILLSGNALAAQAPKRAPATPAAEVFRASEQDAGDTRERLNRIFEQYPPTLKQILRLDPALLTNNDYLSMYPALNEFMTAHPEVAHNPSYFVGNPDTERQRSTDPRQQMIDMWRSVMEAMAASLAIATAIFTFAWLVKTVVDHRRWQRMSKIQADVHTKLLDRFSANEDLLAYIQSPAGRRFLESTPIPMDAGPRAISAPIGRILWSVQAGLVLGFAGLGLRYAIPADIADNIGAQPLSVISMLALAIGVGFVISAAVSYVIS